MVCWIMVVWTFMIQYVLGCEACGAKITTCIRFTLKISKQYSRMRFISKYLEIQRDTKSKSLFTPNRQRAIWRNARAKKNFFFWRWEKNKLSLKWQNILKGKVVFFFLSILYSTLHSTEIILSQDTQRHVDIKEMELVIWEKVSEAESEWQKKPHTFIYIRKHSQLEKHTFAILAQKHIKDDVTSKKRRRRRQWWAKSNGKGKKNLRAKTQLRFC